MEAKVKIALRAYEQGNLKKAFLIFKNFSRDFNKEEQRSLQIAYECLNGHEKFYQELGIIPAVELNKAEWAIRRAYNIV